MAGVTVSNLPRVTQQVHRFLLNRRRCCTGGFQTLIFNNRHLHALPPVMMTALPSADPDPFKGAACFAFALTGPWAAPSGRAVKGFSFNPTQPKSGP